MQERLFGFLSNCKKKKKKKKKMEKYKSIYHLYLFETSFSVLKYFVVKEYNGSMISENS